MRKRQNKSFKVPTTTSAESWMGRAADESCGGMKTSATPHTLALIAAIYSGQPFWTSLSVEQPVVKTKAVMMEMSICLMAERLPPSSAHVCRTSKTQERSFLSDAASVRWETGSSSLSPSVFCFLLILTSSHSHHSLPAFLTQQPRAARAAARLDILRSKNKPLRSHK